MRFPLKLRRQFIHLPGSLTSLLRGVSGNAVPPMNSPVFSQSVAPMDMLPQTLYLTDSHLSSPRLYSIHSRSWLMYQPFSNGSNGMLGRMTPESMRILSTCSEVFPNALASASITRLL